MGDVTQGVDGELQEGSPAGGGGDAERSLPRAEGGDESELPRPIVGKGCLPPRFRQLDLEQLNAGGQVFDPGQPAQVRAHGVGVCCHFLSSTSHAGQCVLALLVFWSLVCAPITSVWAKVILPLPGTIAPPPGAPLSFSSQLTRTGSHRSATSLNTSVMSISTGQETTHRPHPTQPSGPKSSG